ISCLPKHSPPRRLQKQRATPAITWMILCGFGDPGTNTDRFQCESPSRRELTMQSLPVLNQRFGSAESFRVRAGNTFALLPFRFIALDSDRHVLTNFAGEYAVVPKSTVEQLVRHDLDMDFAVYDELKSKHFLLDGDSNVALDLLAVKYRTKQSLLA